ncbi:unnamed protein product [Lathyrus sativus]|nr:unnamed protein product [Lathyrus sativus]
MLEIYLSLKNKLRCKPNSKQVHDPKRFNDQRTKSDLHDHSNIIQGSRRYLINSSSFYRESERSIMDFEGSFRTVTRVSTSSRFTYPDDDYITEHSVTKVEEDSSRKIVEKICERGSSLVSSELWQIDCILKVHNMPKTLTCFEEYREMVKIKANKLHTKNHPRCLVDGNEVLMFHGTNIACSLGINNSHSLCTLDYCGVCQILRHGFSTNKEFQGALGVYTSSTSGKAFDSIVAYDEKEFTRKSVIVCRVIAGRVHCPIEEIQEKVELVFDSLVEKMSDSSDVEELYLLNSKALLPCFVVIYKQQTVKMKRFHSSSRISSI